MREGKVELRPSGEKGQVEQGVEAETALHSKRKKLGTGGDVEVRNKLSET